MAGALASKHATRIVTRIIIWIPPERLLAATKGLVARSILKVQCLLTAGARCALFATSPALQDCFKTVSVGVVCVTGPGPRSGQRTDRALHAGGALAVESKL